jgi:hypothetical protein
MIAEWCDKDLRFMLKAPEWLGMQNPITVALVCRADGAWGFGNIAHGISTSGGIWREGLGFECLTHFAYRWVRHEFAPLIRYLPDVRLS